MRSSQRRITSGSLAGPHEIAYAYRTSSSQAINPAFAWKIRFVSNSSASLRSRGRSRASRLMASNEAWSELAMLMAGVMSILAP